MQNIDHLEVDGRLLETFLAVYEDCSVTRAAERLATNQSTVSHRLDRMRAVVGDDLFVRAGRGIIPTPRAREIAPLVRQMITDLTALVAPPGLVIADMRERFVIAATDYERGLFVISAVKKMMSQAPHSRFDFVWDQYDSGDALRHGKYDIALSPTAVSDASGLFSAPLFRDRFRCFYDPRVRRAPDTLELYAQARHVRIIFSASDTSFVDAALAPLEVKRSIASELPSINELPGFLSGTDLVATMPARLAYGLMADFAQCPVPFHLPPLTISMFWHRRTHASPAHAWVRDQLAAAALPLV